MSLIENLTLVLSADHLADPAALTQLRVTLPLAISRVDPLSIDLCLGSEVTSQMIEI